MSTYDFSSPLFNTMLASLNESIDLHKMDAAHVPSNIAEKLFHDCVNMPNDASETYANAQLVLAHLICFHSNLTPNTFHQESPLNKRQRLQAMMPYLRKAARAGLESAQFSLSRLETQLFSLQESEMV